MNTSDTLIIGSLILRLFAAVAGFGLAFLGYKLYVRGLRREAGRIEAAWGDKKFVMENAVPGSFLVVLGTIIVLVSLLSKTSFEAGPRAGDTAGGTDVTTGQPAPDPAYDAVRVRAVIP